MATISYIMGLPKSSAAKAAKLMGVASTTLARLMGTGLGVQASGGTWSVSSGYTIHTFTAGGTLTVHTGGGQAGGDVEYLVVAGGGGGGGLTGVSGGGGGGAGGYLAGTGHAVTPQAYSITVGAGGVVDAIGANSVFDTKTAIRGGNGGRLSVSWGIDGGSGGGAAANNGDSTVGVGTAGPPRQGYDGGKGKIVDANGGGGGGGGASAAGSTTTDDTGANGGAGISNSISGSPVTYATGGRGGDVTTNAGGATGGANTGDGGGAGLSGGSGIVIIRYLA